MDERIRLGISACLLGERTRYDGGHKRDPFLVDTLGRYVEYVPVCPEVECGLPVPREPMRLVGDPQAPRLVTVRTERDMTARMQSWARKRLEGLAREDLCGFIFRRGSPSSGMERVKVYPEKGGPPSRKGRGLFAALFRDRFPSLPVEEDGRLHDPRLRENFIVRIFTLRRWRETRRRGTPGSLVEFHTRNKLLILSHNQALYRKMGPLVAQGKKAGRKELFARYESILLEALRLTATPKKHANVLQHILGYFKRDLAPDEKTECLEIIDRFRQGQIPLIVPVTLLHHFVRKYDQPYLKEQTYLEPHPLELQLRNHV